MATASFKINQREARLVFGHIGTPRGRDALGAEKRLVEASRANFTGKIEAFRVVQILEGEQLRPDVIACTSRCLKAAAHISTNQPGIVFFQGNVIPVTPIFLRYEIPASRVLADIPFLAKAAAKAIPAETISRRKTGQESIPKQMLLDAANEEKEIIADLTGIAPTHIFKMESHIQKSLFYGALLYGDGRPGDDAEIVERFANGAGAREKNAVLAELSDARQILSFHTFSNAYKRKPAKRPEPEISSLPAKQGRPLVLKLGKPVPAFT